MLRGMVLAALCLFVFSAATLAADAPPSQTKTGTIKSVDAAAKTFVLTLPARPLTFQVQENTVITLDGKPSSLEAAIQPERTTTVTYTRSGEQRTATKVEVKSEEAKPAEAK